DLCRTHAALGVERNFLGAEKACGLYLAGVTFGGPDMHEVRISTEHTDLWQKESQWVLDQLEEMIFYYPVASSLIKNLKYLWKGKGNYWNEIKKANEIE